MHSASHTHLLASLLILGALGANACGSAQSSARREAADRRAAREPELKNPMRVADVGFAAPESVLYDERADVYLISNVQGSALDVDDRAFISRLRPDGTLEALKWIDAASEGVTLNAPKGMALVEESLFVADIDEVRVFDRVSGKPLRTIHVAGASFLNDIAAAQDGSLFVTDSGLKTGFAPSGTDAVLHIDREDRVTTIIRGEELGRPNGLLIADDGVWVSTFGTGEMYRIDNQGLRRDVKRLPKGSLDGMALLDGRIYVASWEASAIYRADGERAEEVITELDAPADIGIDPKRRRLLVPLYLENAVVIHQL